MRREYKVGFLFFILGILIAIMGAMAYLFRSLITVPVVVTGVISLITGFFTLAAVRWLVGLRNSKWIVVAVYSPAAHDVIGEYRAVTSEDAKHKAMNHNMWDVATERMEDKGGHIVVASVDGGQRIQFGDPDEDDIWVRR